MAVTARQDFTKTQGDHLSVRMFGALGLGASSVVADTAGCAAGFAYVAANGGSLLIPDDGVFVVDPSGTDKDHPLLALGSNMRVYGKGIIRVKANAGDYFSLMASPYSVSSTLSNLVLEDFTIDQNVLANTTSSISVASSATTSQVAIGIFGDVKNARVRNVTLYASGINTITGNSQGADDVDIEKCTFYWQKRTAQAGFDNSAIYFSCGHARTGAVNTSGTAVTWVSGDEFSATQVGRRMDINGASYVVRSYTDSHHLTLSTTAGTQAAVAYVNPQLGRVNITGNKFFADWNDFPVTAIELHNCTGVVTNNHVAGYQTAHILFGTQDLVLSHNTGEDLLFGCRLWSETGYTVRGLKAFGNIWRFNNTARAAIVTAGLTTEFDSGDGIAGDFEDLQIHDNQFFFDRRTSSGGSYFLNAGISLICEGNLTNVEIYNNLIVNAPIRGIKLGGAEGITGTANTSGTAVTRVSGPLFTASLVGQAFLIAGVSYTVASFTDSTHIALGASAGTQTGAATLYPTWQKRVYVEDNTIIDAGNNQDATAQFYCAAIWASGNFQDCGIRRNKIIDTGGTRYGPTALRIDNTGGFTFTRVAMGGNSAVALDGTEYPNVIIGAVLEDGASAPRTVTGSYTALFSDNVLLADSTSGDVIISFLTTLPVGKILTVKKTVAANTVFISTSTVDGESRSLVNANEMLSAQWDGTAWRSIVPTHISDMRYGVRTITAGSTVTASDNTVLCDTTSGSIVLGLPASGCPTGQTVTIKKTVAANSVFIGTSNVDGAGLTMTAQYACIVVQWSGTAWGYVVRDQTAIVTHAAALTANQLIFGDGAGAAKVGNLTGDVTTAGGTATTISAAGMAAINAALGSASGFSTLVAAVKAAIGLGIGDISGLTAALAAKAATGTVTSGPSAGAAHTHTI